MPVFSVGVGGGGDDYISEVPSGVIDGVNSVFTLANTPAAGSEKVYLNGVRLKSGSGNDYLISGATITFLPLVIPQVGDNILVDYSE